MDKGRKGLGTGGNRDSSRRYDYPLGRPYWWPSVLRDPYASLRCGGIAFIAAGEQMSSGSESRHPGQCEPRGWRALLRCVY